MHMKTFDDLFEDFLYVEATTGRRGNTQYPAQPGWYFLAGLPGSILLPNKDRPQGAALFVKPLLPVLEKAQAGMTNGVIGSFRAVQSAYWLERGLLPVYAIDSHHIANRLIDYVDYAQHGRWNHGQ